MGERERKQKKKKRKQMEGIAESESFSGYWCKVNKSQLASTKQRTLRGKPGGSSKIVVHVYICCELVLCVDGRARAMSWERRTAFSHQKYTHDNDYIDISSSIV
jgi:hypothetical protein